ncbi:DUF6191 domain-containing protein [Streptomyces sp. NPDC097619]|uniref:DUF6191 domain-containing protein n=1 Tax=Streptomyces sp. NPDC097619 TaxID=3157228 RepID=UPI00331F8592
MFSSLDELFAPGRRHAEEERRRLELTRTDAPDADPGRGPVDLESGRILIRLAEQEPESGAQPGSGSGSGTA